MNWLMMTIAMAEETVLVGDLQSADTVSYTEELNYRMSIEHALTNRLLKEYRIVGRENFIPEMEKNDKEMRCVTANCALNMARDLRMDWLVTSELAGDFLIVTLLDVEANKPVVSQRWRSESRSELLDVDPSLIINWLNDEKKEEPKSSWLSRVRVAPPPPEAIVITLVAAPVVWLFVDNISNIVEK